MKSHAQKCLENLKQIYLTPFQLHEKEAGAVIRELFAAIERDTRERNVLQRDFEAFCEHYEIGDSVTAVALTWERLEKHFIVELPEEK